MSAGPSQGLYTIAPGHPFLRDLARGIITRFHRPDDPLALASAIIFLPTRRAERQLREELIAAAETEALIMPSIRVLGDVDEDEGQIDVQADLGELDPEISRLERELILARRLDTLRKGTGSGGGFGVSLALAKSLAQLIDDAANEDGDLAGLADLAPADLAQHWEATVGLLRSATTEWPALLKSRRRMDPVERRNRLIRAYAMRLASTKPTTPFMVAGSSGSIRATADLMRVIAGLPQGAVVLDGLDTQLEAESWDCLPPSHPQFALKEALIHLGVDRHVVQPWIKGAAAITPRAIFLSEATRPPETADRWSARVERERAVMAAGVDGLSHLEAANEREEALAVALAIRETLETPTATAALVTADRMLARRVLAELRRWNIEADDSAGRPLAKTEAGATITLSLEAAMAGGAPLALLSMLKHPCMTLNRSRSWVLQTTRRLERRVLRRERITGGFDVIRRTIEALPAEDGDRVAMLDLLETAESGLKPLMAFIGGRHDLAAMATAHRDALDLLTCDHKTGHAGAWKGVDGEAAYGLLQDLIEAGTGAALHLTMEEYAVVVDNAARGVAVRPQGPRHQRVSIWGPLEARMQTADLIILGSLNEGVWPTNPADDPWLSRPMREQLKLSVPERRIGLAAHDFVAMAAQPRVLLTRAKRQGGAPANPSRFLLRLTTLAEGAAAPIPASPLLDIARRLDLTGPPVPAPRPMPRPPREARPRLLSVTRIETWVRDPYAIYAEQVLQLKPLDALMQARNARDRGMMIHKAIELFAGCQPDARDPFDILMTCGREAFGAALDEPDIRAFWWPRFCRAARWLADQETKWAAGRLASVVEKRCEYRLEDVDFTLTGQPDRIDRLASGGVRVIDYKTGAVPTKKQVAAFMAPQLPLLAAMAAAGAFGDDLKGHPEQLVYAHVSGGKIEGQVMLLENPAELVAELLARLRARIIQFDDEKTPYQPRRAVQSTRHRGDYDHLSRLDEWGGTNEAEL